MYTKATVALHNYLIRGRNQGSDQYCPSGFADVDLGGQCREGEWRSVVQKDTGLGSVNRVVRDLFFECFISEEGQVPWQWDIIKSRYFVRMKMTGVGLQPTTSRFVL